MADTPRTRAVFSELGAFHVSRIEGFPARRKVAIRRDQDDYVIVVQPEDLVLFRNPSATAQGL
jgi:hypothetical protein